MLGKNLYVMVPWLKVELKEWKPSRDNWKGNPKILTFRFLFVNEQINMS